VDALDLATLHQLHNYVHPNMKKKVTKRKNGNKRRTHYSEKDADRMIHNLEQTLKKFDEKSSSPPQQQQQQQQQTYHHHSKLYIYGVNNNIFNIYL
jgi:Holliday junction resolvasome RuvABC DNA-binding subunit